MSSIDNTLQTTCNNTEDSVKSNILDKLQKIKDDKDWNDWTLEEKKEMLEIYLSICKKEKYLFELIYNIHGCDTWEDIFRDYDSQYLDDKTDGVKEALDLIENYSKMEE